LGSPLPDPSLRLRMTQHSTFRDSLASRAAVLAIIVAIGAWLSGPGRFATRIREAVRREAPEAADRDFETAFVAFLHHRGH